MMVIPLILGSVFNTFLPEALHIGGFKTALFKDGANAFISYCIRRYRVFKTFFWELTYDSSYPDANFWDIVQPQTMQ